MQLQPPLVTSLIWYMYTHSHIYAILFQDGKNDKLINRALELLSQWNAGLTNVKGHGLVKDACADLQKEGTAVL